MNKAIESKIDSTIYVRLNAIRMSPSDRQQALHALHQAELLADAFAWAARKIEQMLGRSFLKPALKH